MSKLKQLIIDFHQTLHEKLVKGEFDIYEKKEISKNTNKYNIKIEGIPFNLEETIFKKRKSGEITIDDYEVYLLNLEVLPDGKRANSSLIKKAIECKEREAKTANIKSKISELEKELKDLES